MRSHPDADRISLTTAHTVSAIRTSGTNGNAKRTNMTPSPATVTIGSTTSPASSPKRDLKRTTGRKTSRKQAEGQENQAEDELHQQQ